MAWEGQNDSWKRGRAAHRDDPGSSKPGPAEVSAGMPPYTTRRSVLTSGTAGWVHAESRIQAGISDPPSGRLSQ